MDKTDNISKTLKDFADSAKKVMRVPALKGHLGGVDFFIITLTMGEAPRYIVGTDPNLEPILRENRRANPSRYAEIADYMVKNIDNYRFSAITCTYGKNGTDKPDSWEPADPNSPPGSPGWMLGMLTLSQADPLIIVDGQHRLGAIQKAIEAEPELRNDSIAVVLFPYMSLGTNQQLFSDLNRTAKPPTKSLNILFNTRDIENRVVRAVVERVSVFKERVNLELVSVAKSQNELFTLAGVYQATKPMINGLFEGGVMKAELHGAESGTDQISNEKEYVDNLVDAWEFIASQFPEWGRIVKNETDIATHRAKYLDLNSGVFSSIGEFVGNAMRDCGPNWKNPVKIALGHVDNGNWQRDAKYWGGIILAGDQVLPRSVVRVQLIAYLKLKAGLTLSQGEKKALSSLAPEVQARIGFNATKIT